MFTLIVEFSYPTTLRKPAGGLQARVYLPRVGLRNGVSTGHLNREAGISRDDTFTDNRAIVETFKKQFMDLVLGVMRA